MANGRINSPASERAATKVALAPLMAILPAICVNICAALVAAIALFQAVTPITYETAWDVDPRSTSGKAVITELSPDGYAILCSISLGVAVLSLFSHRLAGGRVHRASVVLFTLGSLAALAHCNGNISDLVRCSGWIASAALGLAALHLAAHERARRILLAAGVALIIPFALRAVWYVAVEHPATVRDFMNRRDDILRERGWRPDSAMAQLFERRMLNNQVTGAYAMSNVHGSISAAITAGAFGIAAALWRKRRGASIGFFALAIAGAAVVVMTKSRGAAVACAIAGVWSIAVMWWTAKRESPGWFSLIAPALVALAITAVLLRGALPPPDAQRGERSLFVRGQYWAAAWKMVKSEFPKSPTTFFIGVGPERFHEDYTRYKDPTNPEEITSAHAAFVDWPVMLGVGGVAWCAAALVWLAAAMRIPRDEMDQTSDTRDTNDLPLSLAGDIYTKRGILAAHAIALAVFVPQYIIQLPLMMPETALLWLVGLEGFAVVFFFASAVSRTDGRLVRLAASAAGIVVLVHSQIEMTLFNPGSAAMGWMLLGLAAGPSLVSVNESNPQKHSTADAAWHWSVMTITALLFVILTIGYTGRMFVRERHIRRAAEALRGDLPMVSPAAELDAALKILPDDPSLARSRTEREFEMGQRLLDLKNRAGAREAFARAEKLLDQYKAEGVWDNRLRRAAAQLHELCAGVYGEQKHLGLAIALRNELVERNPASLNDRLALADLLWNAGQRSNARAVYQRCLELSDLARMDPAKQLSDADHARVLQRLSQSD